MAENKQNVTDVMDEGQKVEPKTKNNEPENEPENTQDGQKETLTVFKKAKKSKRLRTGFVVALSAGVGYLIGRLTRKSNEPTEPTEEVIDVEPEEETAE